MQGDVQGLSQMAMESQRIAQASAETVRNCEEQVTMMQWKMSQMEQLLITQWQKSQKLESQLSATQDYIGGAERKARLLETENGKIESELQFCNDAY